MSCLKIVPKCRREQRGLINDVQVWSLARVRGWRRRCHRRGRQFAFSSRGPVDEDEGVSSRYVEGGGGEKKGIWIAIVVVSF